MNEYEMMPDDALCEVCGNYCLGTTRVVDVCEIPTTTQYRTWEAREHYFCAAHARPAVEVYLDGRVFTDAQNCERARYGQNALKISGHSDEEIACEIEGWVLGCQDIFRRKAGVAR